MFKKYAILFIYIILCISILCALAIFLFSFQNELKQAVSNKVERIESCILPPNFSQTESAKISAKEIKYIKKIVVIKVPEPAVSKNKIGKKQESLLACLNEYKACQGDLWCNARGCDELRAYWKGRYGK